MVDGSDVCCVSKYQLFRVESVNKYSLVHLVMPKMEEPISRTLLGLFKIRLLFQDRVRSQNLRFEWQCSSDHFFCFNPAHQAVFH